MIKTILLVEDEVIIAMSQKQMIKHLGYNVITANSGREAVQLAAGNSAIDLILMDIDLGKGMDGTEAAAIILKDQDIPVVFLSSHTELDVVEKTEKITSYGYVVKNSGETVLAASIKMAFKLHDARLKEQANEDALRESEKRYRLLADNAADVIWTMTLDGRFTYVSHSITSLTGYTPEEILAIPFSEYVVESYVEPIMKEIAAQLMKPQSERLQNLHVELQQYCKDRSIKDIEVSVSWLMNDNGHIAGIQGSTRDITDRKRAEEESTLSKVNMEAIIESTDDIIASYDRDVRLLVFNKACRDVYRKLFGIELQPGLRTLDLFPESQRGFWTANNTRALAGESFSVEFSLPAANSQILTFESYFNPIRRGGEVVGFSTFTRDITARNQMVEEMRSRNTSLDSIIENIPNMLFLKEARDLRFVRFNRAGEELLGYSKADMIGKNDYDFFPVEQAEFFTRKDREVLQGKEVVDIPEEVIKTRVKGERILHTKKVPIMNEIGEPEYLLGISEDITEHKHVEEILSESEQRLSAIIDFFPDATLAIDKDKRIIIWNRAIEEMTGIPASEMIGKGDYAYTIPFYGVARPQLMDLFWLSDSEIINKYPILKKEGDNLVIEVFCPALNRGKGAFVWAKASPLRDYKGQLIGAIECIRDITDRKRAEESLTANEKRFRHLSGMISDIAYSCIKYTDAPFSIDWITGAVDRITGYTADEILAMTCWRPLVITEDIPLFDQHVIGLAPGQSQHCDLRLRRKDGGIVWIASYAECAASVNDRQSAILYGSCLDITERKLAEEALKKSEAKFQFLAENMADAVFTLDLNLDTTYVSPSIEKILGFTPEERKAQKADQQLTPESRELVFAKLMEELQKEKEKSEDPNRSLTIELNFYHKDGSIRNLETHIKALRDSKGSLTGFYGACHNITERKRSEVELQKQLAEKEVLLKEVHHRVKNNISNIEGLLILQADSADIPEVKSALQDSISHVQSMRVLYDKLLISKDYHKVSIKIYAESLINSLVEVFTLGQNITIDKQIAEFDIVSKKAITVGIIINELMTNVLKYAFKGCGSGTVSIIIKKDKNLATLIIHDNGIGFDERLESTRSPGFGLTIVKMLVDLLKGTYTIKNENGTESIIQFEI